MKTFKSIVTLAAISVFLICLYSFLLGNEVFAGKFSNDAFAWYFLAKGVFCSMALFLMVSLLEAFKGRS